MNNIQMLNEGFDRKYLKEAEEIEKEEDDSIEVGDLFLNGDETYKLLDIQMDEDGNVTVDAENDETGEEEEIEYAPVALDDEEDVEISESFRKRYNEGYTPLTILKDPEGKMGSISVVKAPSGKFYIEDENGSVAGPYDSYSDAVKYAHKFRPTFKDVGLYKESYRRRLKEAYGGYEFVTQFSFDILWHDSGNDDYDIPIEEIKELIEDNGMECIGEDYYSMDDQYKEIIEDSGDEAHASQISIGVAHDGSDDITALIPEVRDILSNYDMELLGYDFIDMTEDYDEFDESLREGAVGSAIGGAISSKLGLGNVGADVGDRAEEFLKDKFKRYAWENNMSPEEAAWELGKKGFEYGKVYGKKAAPYMKSAAHKAGQMAKSGASKLGSARQKLANRPKPNMSAIKNSAAGAVGRVANSAKRFGNDVKSAYNQGRNSALANESYLRESMRKYTKSQLADIVRKGWAEDISDYDFNQMDDFLMKHNLDKIGYSSGKYGINGGLLQDKDTGDWYAIVGRNSALFQAF